MRSWKTVLALTLVAGSLGAGVSTAQAQDAWQRDRWDDRRAEARFNMDSRDWAHQFERRLNRVAMRIDEAAQRGDLSPREVRHLSWQRDRLAAREQNAISDRYLSSHEREYLDQELFALARQLRIDVADAW
ncbi:hypothetical protein [Roseiterribacter gracilis]|uniref:Uncharacterized protein n=1 Tax=Roseiterribacter gracilis TaxID=2812848 RepID=A0A8S8X861_9PROT|nr:hypothetical protein TMPK1_03190 [Rhodospirillales bacterium TMPK1]